MVPAQSHVPINEKEPSPRVSTYPASVSLPPEFLEPTLRAFPSADARKALWHQYQVQCWLGGIMKFVVIPSYQPLSSSGNYLVRGSIYDYWLSGEWKIIKDDYIVLVICNN